MSDISFQVRKGLDRVGFEADKRMRSQRVRQESQRVRGQAEDKTLELGAKVLELAAAGRPLDPSLHDLIKEIMGLQEDIRLKEEEIAAIRAEAWVAPLPPPPTPPAPQAAALPQGASTPRPATQAERRAPGIGSAKSSSSGGSANRLKTYVEEDAQVISCPRCNGKIRSMASFCPQCGYRRPPEALTQNPPK